MTTTHTEIMKGGVSKRVHFGWTLADAPGEFAMLPKNKLHVDPSYQRKPKEAKVNELASKWSWIACGAITVALRQDCEWYVMDGWHRVLAARKRDDIRDLPCLVFVVENKPQEAQGFLNTNTNRRPPGAVDKLNAQLTTGDKAALVVKELADASGRSVSAASGPSNFGAVGIAMRLVEDDEETFRHIWPIVVELCAGHSIHQNLLMGMWHLQRSTEEDLMSARWKKRILETGYMAIRTSISETAAYFGAGKSYKVCAIGIAKAINKGLRKPLQHSVQEPKV